MNCPSCGTSVPPKAEFCPQCLGEVAPHAPAPGRAVAPAAPQPLAEEARSSPPAAMASPPLASQEGPICKRHPYDPARTCRECSAFYCARCLPAGAKPVLCPRCNTTLALRDAPEKLRRSFRELWISPLIMGIAVVAVSAVMGLVTGATEAIIMMPIIGGVIGAPFFVLALVIALSRAVAVAWLCFVLEVLLLLFFLLSFVNLFSLVFVAVAAIIPIMTVIQIFKIKDLQALQRAHPGEQAPVPQAATKT